jgi:hypothetical protein
LDVGIDKRPDGKLFGIFTKSLACFTLVLFWLALLIVWKEPEQSLPLWKKCTLFYCGTTFCWFLIYLAALYDPIRHHATTTYLTHFTGLVGTLLIPVTWPVLFVLGRRICRAAETTVS